MGKEESDIVTNTLGSSSSGENIIDSRPTGVASNGNLIDDGLQRGLKGRHMQMIALGGVVGASIWYGTGFALVYSGPVGALICFFVVGIDVYFVMQSLGEMSTLFPVPGAFNELAGRFVDPALSFALGWNYWYLWVTNLATEYNNFSIILGLWTDKVPSYGWILIAWAFFQCLALFGVVVYGEVEFWLSTWKFFCVVCGFLVAILINTGAIGGDYIGFRYWAHPGPFANGINGFGQTFVLAAVYYCGTEMLAICGGESRNPKRDLPKAIRQTFWRILIIFIGLMFFASILVPSDSPLLLSAKTKSGQSPWTVALVQAGWPGAGNLLNVVMVTALFSSVNSTLYIVSRSLVSLAKLGRAPKFFAKTTKNGVPVNAILFSNLLGLLSLLNITAGAGQVFTYLVDISGAATFIAWGFIGVTHIRMRKAYVAQGYNIKDLPFKAFLYPYGAIWVVFFNFFMVIISGYTTVIPPFQAVNFVFSYLVIPIFCGLYILWKVLKRTKWVKLTEADLVSGRREDLVPYTEEEPKASRVVRVKRFFLG